MELEQLSLLEAKIYRLVEFVATLKAKNKDLQTNIRGLQNTSSAQEKQVFELEKQLAEEKEKNKNNDIRFSNEREKIVRKKIEQIIAKIESLEFEL